MYVPYENNLSVWFQKRSFTLCFTASNGGVMRRPDFCLCENKGADQLCSNCTADLISVFVYATQISILCSCTGRFVSDLVGDPEDRFSHIAAQMVASFVS